MTALFSSPPKPAPVTAVTGGTVPTQSTSDVQAAADAQRVRAANAMGRNATLLTGLDTTAGPSMGKTLLGSSGP